MALMMLSYLLAHIDMMFAPAVLLLVGLTLLLDAAMVRLGFIPFTARRTELDVPGRLARGEINRQRIEGDATQPRQ